MIKSKKYLSVGIAIIAILLVSILCIAIIEVEPAYAQSTSNQISQEVYDKCEDYTDSFLLQGDNSSNLLLTEYEGYINTQTENYYIIYYVNGGTGTQIAPSSHVYNEAKALTANTYTKIGYTFAGWNSESDGTGDVYSNRQSVVNITVNGGLIQLFAQWTANTYIISYNSGGAIGQTDNSSHTYDVSKALITNGFSKTGYTFAGWATTYVGSVVYSDGQSVENLATSESITLFAKWTANTYSIVYDKNGGTGTQMAPSSHIYDVSKALTANTYTRANYTFTGWSETATGTLPIYGNEQLLTDLAPSGSVTLYARWTPNTYIIIYNGGGENGQTDDSTHKYDVSKALTSNGFSKTGFTFAGWATTDGGPVVYSNGQSVTNLATGGSITLFAKWNKILFAGGNGSAEDPFIINNEEHFNDIVISEARGEQYFYEQHGDLNFSETPDTSDINFYGTYSVYSGTITGGNMLFNENHGTIRGVNVLLDSGSYVLVHNNFGLIADCIIGTAILGAQLLISENNSGEILTCTLIYESEYFFNIVTSTNSGLVIYSRIIGNGIIHTSFGDLLFDAGEVIECTCDNEEFCICDHCYSCGDSEEFCECICDCEGPCTCGVNRCYCIGASECYFDENSDGFVCVTLNVFAFMMVAIITNET